ncbi:hypothetical protein QR685DRAFT_561383 [Neurospora intermedia]|uniref:Uncharacterized protein n=1 Tax=Neurospora intermedia TaxID=5142 RepID=A0ABR3DG49_NEUIN
MPSKVFIGILCSGSSWAHGFSSACGKAVTCKDIYRKDEMLLPDTGIGAVDSPEKTFLDVQGSDLRQHFSDVAMEEDAYWLSNTSMADRVQGYKSG